MEYYENIIHRTFDDSYVITKNGMPYHVCSNVEEFEEEWKAVNAYAKALSLIHISEPTRH